MAIQFDLYLRPCGPDDHAGERRFGYISINNAVKNCRTGEYACTDRHEKSHVLDEAKIWPSQSSTPPSPTEPSHETLTNVTEIKFRPALRRSLSLERLDLLASLWQTAFDHDHDHDDCGVSNGRSKLWGKLTGLANQFDDHSHIREWLDQNLNGGSPHSGIENYNGNVKPDCFGKSNLVNRRKKQLSLPTQLSLFLSVAKRRDHVTNEKRRKSSGVRFADQFGENLATFVIIPSRFDEGDASSSDEYSLRYSDSTSSTFHISDLGHKSLENTSKMTARHLANNCETTTSASRFGVVHQMPSSPPLQRKKPPPFYLCFDQPAADFETFREKLERQRVALENVRIDITACRQRSDIAVFGTVLCSIKVRNLDLTKRVFARYTDNAWASYVDIVAHYVNGHADHFEDYDTFSFAVRRPVSAVSSKAARRPASCSKIVVEFAICYEVLGQTFWDNNDGQNYRIVWS